MKKIIAILLSCIFILSLAACGGGSAAPANTASGSSGSETAAPGEAAAVRDSIVIGTDSDCGSLDPYVITGAGFFPVWICYAEPLWINDGSGDGFATRYILAESVDTINECEYVIHLRKGVTFSNGNPFNAEDVLYTLDFVQNNPSRSYYVPVVDLEKSYAEDDYTVHLYLSAYDKTQMSSLQDLPMLDAESYDPDSYGQNPVGTGPYVVTQYTVNSSVKLQARDDYWGDAPQIKNVEFKNIPESSQKVTALETGEVDALINCPDSDTEYIASLDGMNVVSKTSIQQVNMFFNCAAGSPLATKEARWAVAYAVDKAAVCNIALSGNGTPATCMFSSGTSDYFEGLDNLHDTYATGYDLELAKKYAEESGLVGKTVRLVTNGDSVYVTTAEIVQQALKEIGVDAQVINYDQATVRNLVVSDEGWEIYVTWTANPSGVGGDIIYGNAWKFNMPRLTGDQEIYDKFGTLGAQLLATSDTEEYNRQLVEYVTFAEDYCPWIGIASRSIVCAATSDVHDFGYYAFSYHRVADWHFD